nr:GMC family oxidoreductase N-terminal domain-containing protein [Asaia prunellae]
MKSLNKFDYIIIGAGSAGSVLATRIIQANMGSVLLLEAGGSDRNLFVHMPAAVGKVIPTKTWAYQTEPDVQTGERSMTVAQGRILGGSSSVNGMIYIRGQKADYDSWAAQHGCSGWSYNDLLPYFIKSERNESLSGTLHGIKGPLPVSENRYRHPLTGAFIRAGQEFGLPYVNDFNATDQTGIGYFQTTTLRGARASTAQTYLKSVADKAELTLVLNALVTKVKVKGHKATGVSFIQDGREQTVESRSEIIVSAGAIGSPKILMLSGIGVPEHLRDVGISPLMDLPVGRDLQDHLHMSINATTKHPTSLYGQDRGLKALRNGIEWLGFRSGVVTSNILEGGAFIDTTGQGQPDVQIHFLPVLDSWDDPDGVGKGRTHGLTLKVGHLQPKSRGEVRLASADPRMLPLIHANYLHHPDDLPGQLRAVLTGLRFLKMPSLRNEIEAVFSPDRIEARDEEGLRRYIRQGCKTTYHPIGTCRMGVDPKIRSLT